MEEPRTFYEKRGRKYYPIGQEFTGFPANGVWYVEDGRQNLFMKVGDLPDPMPLAALEPYREQVAKALCEHFQANPGPISANDIVDATFRSLVAAMQSAGDTISANAGKE